MTANTFSERAMSPEAKTICEFLDQLKKNRPADQAGEQHRFTQTFLPAFESCCANGHPSVALDVEQLLYQIYIKRWEDEQHFRITYDALVPPLRKLGQRIASDLMNIGTDRRIYTEKANETPIVFFLIHVESDLAHIQSLLRYLESINKFGTGKSKLKPVVVSMDGRNVFLRKRLNELQIPLVSLADTQPQPCNAYAKVIKFIALCCADRPRAIVFVSVVLWMATLYAIRLAPAQIWWAMKYHAFSSPDIDGYMCGSPDGRPRTIGGKHWETAPFGGADWFAPELRAAASSTRAALGNWRTVFGSIGREEKLRDPGFLDAVCGVLKANPESCFIWTGSQQDPVIRSYFEAAQLEHRTHFVGWIDTRLYAQVIDVYLDSFPFPGGYTVYQAMAARRPVVMMRLSYPNVGLQNNVSPHYFTNSASDAVGVAIQGHFRKTEGRIYYPVAENVAEYVAFATRFARDTKLYAEVGRINAEFVERFMSNQQGMAIGYSNIVHKFIDHALRSKRQC